jgi:hypothetical protein
MKHNADFSGNTMKTTTDWARRKGTFVGLGSPSSFNTIDVRALTDYRWAAMPLIGVSLQPLVFFWNRVDAARK